jgi:NAD+ synthase
MCSRQRKVVASISHDAGHAHGVLIPISGGSDSALCFWACVQALGRDKVLGVYVGYELGLRCREWFESIGNVLYLAEDPSWKDKEIMRWAEFQRVAKERNLWLVGSRNRTEEFLGTISIASRVATYLPLVGLWKSEIMVLCDEVGVPKEITDSSRRADPDCGRPQEMAEIPLELVDLFLRSRPGSPELHEKLTPEQIAYLTQVKERNAFKRKLPTRGKRIEVLRRPRLHTLAGNRRHNNRCRGLATPRTGDK